MSFHMSDTAIASTISFPKWASVYTWYMKNMPSHGKRWVLNALHSIGLRSGKPFACRMRNGTVIAISPKESATPWTVGGYCFLERVFEPNTENCIRRLLRPGHTAIDIGANIGYVSAVMAQSVGPTGRVWSFEPVPSTFQLLRLCPSLNGFSQMTPRALALGASQGSVQIHFDPTVAGWASMYSDPGTDNWECATVDIVTLDALVKAGEVTLPNLIKVDVEGHERDVLLGARNTISRAKPDILFEFNVRSAKLAGWGLDEVASLLRQEGDYHFHVVLNDGSCQAIDTKSFEVVNKPHVDILATIQGQIA